jgi:methylmalonyl-CoA decarboxylase
MRSEDMTEISVLTAEQATHTAPIALCAPEAAYPIIVRLENAIGTLILNLPSKRNSIGKDFAEAFVAAFEQLERAQAQVVVLRAMPGVRVWSAGHDVHELPTGGRDPLGYQDPLDRVLRCVQDCPVPVIAMVEGSVWGGAFDLCVSCDMIVCGEDTTFALTPAKLGVPYSASGLIRFLNVLGPQKAKELLFTAKPISAETALQARMVNHVVPREELEPVTYGIAETIARNAPLAVQAIKQQFRLLLQSQTLAPETFERIQGIRRVVYDSQDYQEGIQAFKEKRKPEFHGR